MVVRRPDPANRRNQYERFRDGHEIVLCPTSLERTVVVVGWWWWYYSYDWAMMMGIVVDSAEQNRMARMDVHSDRVVVVVVVVVVVTRIVMRRAVVVRIHNNWSLSLFSLSSFGTIVDSVS